MSVSREVQEFINNPLAQNNRALLDQISKLVADSVDSIKCSSEEVTDDQLREIKKLSREEPGSVKAQRQQNPIQIQFQASGFIGLCQIASRGQRSRQG